MTPLTTPLEDKAREVLARVMRRHAFIESAEIIERREDVPGDGAACALDAMLAFADMRLDEAAEEARPSFEDGYPFDPERILDLKTNPAKDTQ